MPSSAHQPWTVQERVSDLAFLEGRLYLAVNSHGVAEMKLPAGEGQPRFSYYYDPTLFRFRTLTAVIPQGQSLLLHLYFNQLLNVTYAESLPLRGVSLLELFPGEAVYRVLPVPFQKTHPGWECVGFSPRSAEQFALEWKQASPTVTRFAYTQFSMRGLTEQPSERGTYRRTCEPEPADTRLPAPLQLLIWEAIRRCPARNRNETAFHFRVRSAGEPLARLYSRYPSGFERAPRPRLLKMHVFHEGERCLLMSPEGLVLASRASARDKIEILRLPPLPEGFSYTDFFVFEGRLAVPWEQADFTQVGAAGIFISIRL